MEKPIKGQLVRWSPRTRRDLRRASEKLPHQRSVIAQREFTANAVLVAERIDIKGLSGFDIIATSPFMIKFPAGGVAAIFKYGAIVFFNVLEDERAQLLNTIALHLSGTGDPGAEEMVMIKVNPNEEEGPAAQSIDIKSADRLRLQLIAEVLAKASMLTFHERRAARDFDLNEPLARDLSENGKFSVKPAELLKAIGSMLLAENRLNGRASVLDRPDLLWDNPGLSGFYARLEGEYELQDRATALDRKLATLSHTSETLVETVRYHSLHRLEVAILLLIFVELCSGLYGHFLHLAM